MQFSFENLGLALNVEVLRRFVRVDGLNVVDLGCGSMTFSKILNDEGASVIAIDPDPNQAQRNRDAKTESNSGIAFVEAGADSIPSTNHSLDGVFFCHSLHHIPAELYAEVFGEVRRVLKHDGFVYVIEPIGGPLNDVMRLFHDEEAERAAAWKALSAFADEFESVVAVEYHSVSSFDSWDSFAENFSNRSFNSNYSNEDVRRKEVRDAFETMATKVPDGYTFPVNKRVVILSKPKF